MSIINEIQGQADGGYSVTIHQDGSAAAASGSGVRSAEEWNALRDRLPALVNRLPDGMQRFPKGTELDTVIAALARDGTCVLLNAVSDECVDMCIEEMKPYLDDEATCVRTNRPLVPGRGGRKEAPRRTVPGARAVGI